MLRDAAWKTWCSEAFAYGATHANLRDLRHKYELESKVEPTATKMERIMAETIGKGRENVMALTNAIDEMEEGAELVVAAAELYGFTTFAEFDSLDDKSYNSIVRGLIRVRKEMLHTPESPKFIHYVAEDKLVPLVRCVASEMAGLLLDHSNDVWFANLCAHDKLDPIATRANADKKEAENNDEVALSDINGLPTVPSLSVKTVNSIRSVFDRPGFLVVSSELSQAAEVKQSSCTHIHSHGLGLFVQIKIYQLDKSKPLFGAEQYYKEIGGENLTKIFLKLPPNLLMRDEVLSRLASAGVAANMTGVEATLTHSLTEGSDFTKKKAGDLFKILLTGIIAIGRKDLLHPSVGAEDNDILKLLKKLHLFSDTSKLTGAHADKRPEYAACQKFFAEDNQEQVTRLVGLLWNIFATVERGEEPEEEPSSSADSTPRPVALFPSLLGHQLPLPPPPPPPPS